MPKDFDKKPIIEMNETEFQFAFDSLGAEAHYAMLEDARQGKGQRIYLAVTLLKCPGKPDRIVTTDCEYGDGEAMSTAQSEADAMKRNGALHPGEHLHVALYLVLHMDSRSEVEDD